MTALRFIRARSRAPMIPRERSESTRCRLTKSGLACSSPCPPLWRRRLRLLGGQVLAPADTFMPKAGRPRHPRAEIAEARPAQRLAFQRGADAAARRDLPGAGPQRCLLFRDAPHQRRISPRSGPTSDCRARRAADGDAALVAAARSMLRFPRRW